MYVQFTSCLLGLICKQYYNYSMKVRSYLNLRRFQKDWLFPTICLLFPKPTLTLIKSVFPKEIFDGTLNTRSCSCFQLSPNSKLFSANLQCLKYIMKTCCHHIETSKLNCRGNREINKLLSIRWWQILETFSDVLQSGGRGNRLDLASLTLFICNSLGKNWGN